MGSMNLAFDTSSTLGQKRSCWVGTGIGEHLYDCNAQLCGRERFKKHQSPAAVAPTRAIRVRRRWRRVGARAMTCLRRWIAVHPRRFMRGEGVPCSGGREDAESFVPALLAGSLSMTVSV